MQNLRFSSIAACVLALAAPPVLAGAALDEANRAFTFDSRPIHPFLVREFQNWMSDFRPPLTTSVDVAAAADSNEYAGAVTSDPDGTRCAEERGADDQAGARGSFCYRHVGRLQNGAHVLKTVMSSEGSGAFASIVLVRFDEGGIVWQGHVEPQLRMSVIGAQALQQGDGENLKLSGNQVLVSKAADPSNPTVTRTSGSAPVYQPLDFTQAIVPPAAPVAALAAAVKPVPAAISKPAIAPPAKPAVAAAAPSSAEPAVAYRCASGGIVIATYYPDEDRAVVTYRGKTVPMQIAMSASGARYVGGGFVWWTRGATEGSLFTATASGETGKQLEQCTAADAASVAK